MQKEITQTSRRSARTKAPSKRVVQPKPIREQEQFLAAFPASGDWFRVDVDFNDESVVIIRRVIMFSLHSLPPSLPPLEHYSSQFVRAHCDSCLPENEDGESFIVNGADRSPSGKTWSSEFAAATLSRNPGYFELPTDAWPSPVHHFH